MLDRQTGRNSDQFNLRLPEGMREEIRRLASEDGRSMNAQIVYLLQFALEHSGVDFDELLKLGMTQRLEISRLRKGELARSPADDVSELEQRLADARREADTLRALSATDFGLMWSNLAMLSMISELVVKEKNTVTPALAEVAQKAVEATRAMMSKIKRRADQTPDFDAAMDLAWDWSKIETDKLPRLPKDEGHAGTRRKKA